VSLTIVPFDAAISREQFQSGSIPLDRYIREQAPQDIRRRVSACFMALNSQRQLLAYYTLASASVLLDQLPSAIQKKLPRYAAVPAVRMGRLAVDKSHRQKGLGSTLIADALTRACRSEITAFALIVDAKDHEAIQFYRHHGFMSLSHQGQSLFLPLASVSGLVHSKRVGS
jgi:ribosomal protein S18 acetylase RimI-like enzyme